MKRLQRILIANRGEIACRIIDSVQASGRQAVAVYSDADANARHVRLADTAVAIGAAPASASYLNIEALIGAAQQSGADAIHPGYGFVSENPAMAVACAEAGLVFIGPPAEAIELMGNKAAAKQRLQAAGVPCVPGYQGEDQADETLARAAAEIGYPVMVKAAAGGGGRGMRLVADAEALAGGLRLARTEATSAFGDDRLIIERALLSPRHVEIQVMADAHGNTIHLGERDCSVQRRHQKIIEEAPSPAVDETLRAAMGAAAVSAARDIGYIGAGTVEFLLDADGAFYFLEMNTRLQVEHPVTEMITGLDLVDLQLRIAEGQALALAQDDVTLSGHAIEVRLYAEDPAQLFMPQTGVAEIWRAPDATLARTDSGISSGDTVSPFYDPLLAKIIAHGPDRDSARRRLIRALEQTTLIGVSNNREFLIQALRHAAFADGDATTDFITRHFETMPDTTGESQIVTALAATAWYLAAHRRALQASTCDAALSGWRSDGALASVFRYLQDDAVQRLTVRTTDARHFVIGDQSPLTVGVRAHSEQALTAVIDGDAYEIKVATGDSSITISGSDFKRAFEWPRSGSQIAAAGAGGMIRSPFHGRLCELFVKVGDTVKAGQPLAVIEAMKMQHDIVADGDGKVSAVHVTVDEQIGSDALLIELAS